MRGIRFAAHQVQGPAGLLPLAKGRDERGKCQKPTALQIPRGQGSALAEQAAERVESSHRKAGFPRPICPAPARADLRHLLDDFRVCQRTRRELFQHNTRFFQSPQIVA